MPLYDLSWIKSFANCTEPYKNASVEEQKAYTSMYESVKVNKGFYIGRYETGKDNG